MNRAMIGLGKMGRNKMKHYGIDALAPVITLSLLMRFRSRQEDSFGAKGNAALRNQFGGHAVKTGTA